MHAVDLAGVRAELQRVAALALDAAGLIDASRVGLYPPDQVAAPAVWIEQPTVRPTPGSAGVAIAAVEWSIVVAVDGADRAQIALLDLVVWELWNTLIPLGALTIARPQPLDVGGPNLRGVVLSLTVPTATRC